MARLDPKVLREVLGEVRQRFPVSSVVASTVKLQRAGNEMKAQCPFHEDRSPSFTIYKGDQRWHCFGCGATGDVVDVVRRLHNVGLIEAVRMLDAGALPAVEPGCVPANDTRDADFSDAARRIWQGAAELREDTPAYRYLAGRANASSGKRAAVWVLANEAANG